MVVVEGEEGKEEEDDDDDDDDREWERKSAETAS